MVNSNHFFRMWTFVTNFLHLDFQLLLRFRIESKMVFIRISPLNLFELVFNVFVFSFNFPSSFQKLLNPWLIFFINLEKIKERPWSVDVSIQDFYMFVFLCLNLVFDKSTCNIHYKFPVLVSQSLTQNHIQMFDIKCFVFFSKSPTKIWLIHVQCIISICSPIFASYSELNQKSDQNLGVKWCTGYDNRIQQLIHSNWVTTIKYISIISIFHDNPFETPRLSS